MGKDMNTNRYIVNHSAFGYTPLDFADKSTYENISDSVVAVVVDNSVDEKLSSYYNAIDTLLKNDDRVVLISINDNNESFKSLASLVISRSGYDIYYVEEADNKDLITAQYITDLEKREPDITEVKSYIGGDIIAYNNLDNIMLGIETLVRKGDMKGLATFIEQRSDSIESLLEALNILKKKSDAFDSQELFNMIEQLRGKTEELEDEIEDNNTTIDNLRFENDNLSLQLKSANTELSQLKTQLAELQTNNSYGPSVISTFKEVNTQLINCKVKIILYFKEISYVSHCNTLILMLQEFMNLKKLKTKLLVYDTQTTLYRTYAPLTVVSGKDYLANKDTIINKNSQVVIAEPVPTIINDILLSDQAFDVVIIYDRTRSKNDIVIGNNVSKFYIINSSKDYKEVKNDMGITDTSFIITRAESSITDDKKNKTFLDIPTIEGFDSLTASSKTNKYFRLNSAVTNSPIVQTIINKARIDKLFH